MVVRGGGLLKSGYRSSSDISRTLSLCFHSLLFLPTCLLEYLSIL